MYIIGGNTSCINNSQANSFCVFNHTQDHIQKYNIIIQNLNYSRFIITYAGRPTVPRNSTCVYDERSQLLNVVVNITDIVVNNKETDVSYVSIAVSNGTDLEHLRSYLINHITKINDIFSYTRSLDNIEISVYINVADKCDQQSLSEVISCRVMRSKGN
jgi:hypothetical protein